jgi:pimeloyl-ACP methyl ester carboxylesterase
MAEVTEHSFVLPDGLVCHYLAAGAGEPVVLLHGGGSRASNFAAVMALLGGRFAVVAPDLRGFGATQAVPGAPITHELWATDAIALLDHIGASRAKLVGWSLGATVALNVASRLPDRVSEIALLGAPHPDRPINHAFFQERLRLFRAADDPADVIDRLFPNVVSMFGTAAREHRPEALAQVRAEQIVNAPRAAEVTQSYGTRPSFGDILPHVACPVTLIVGDEDRTCDLAGAQEMALRLADARVIILPQCGHYYAVEQPKATAAALAGAFADAESAAQ